MLRLLFEKRGNAVWISHLDLMRVFQRAFKRAGLPLTHTQGYNPRPSVSIALPMSVGVQSVCELLDFALDTDSVDTKEISEKLNRCLIPGVRVLDVYDGGRKIGELHLMDVQVTLTYDHCVPAGAVTAIEELFCRQSVEVPKKTKSGLQQQDIVPMIRKLAVSTLNDKQIVLNALICCQNPTLNPTQIVSAITLYAPEFKPDDSSCLRVEIYDEQENIFR